MCAKTILPVLILGLFAKVASAADGNVDFARDVLPVLSNKCFLCHGPDAKDPDLVRLDSINGATKDLGGYRAIDPKSPGKSRLLVRIHSKDEPMPPQDAEKQLTKSERELLTRWVKQGGTYAKHWAFVVPKKQLPDSHTDGTNPIDSFIESRIKATGAGFANQADRETLARRAALILTGLPPEPKLRDQFMKDGRPDAYQHYITALFKTPRYGEHQARYWLDAVRYGDTHGLHLDNRRGIYPYRDWVVYALNNNLPLDQFITWQLAGDLLPNPSLAQRVATGYVRMNPTTGEGGAIPAEFQVKNNFDRVETLGTVFLGMSLTCARCHTHKYDPIPQTEYYRLMAFFNSTAEPPMDKNSYTYGNNIKAPQDQAAWLKWSELSLARNNLLAEAEKKFKAAGIAEADAKKWAASGTVERLKLLAAKDGVFAKLELSKSATDISGQLAALEKSYTTTLVAVDLPNPRPTKLLRRGEYNLPVGDDLQPGIVSVMSPFPNEAPRNRLGLARWLTSPEHPLVARVLVNRIWQRTFGEGLVRTPEDFGLQGEYPTHPGLLDWLAVELQDSGWDLQHMLRLMVSSKTFKQSSAWRKDVEDPENHLFSRGPRFRMDAEVIRDIALWSSKLLDPAMGGEGVKPYQPSGMWIALAHPASNTKKYQRDKGQRLYRRSLYVYWKRTSPHPMMTLFDAPNRESSCVKRSRTNSALQSLGLLNEVQRIEMSRKLAERLLHEAKSDAARVNHLFKLLACRDARDIEREACLKLVATMKARYASAKDDAVKLLSIGEVKRDESLDAAEHAAWTQLAVTVLASDVALMLY